MRARARDMIKVRVRFRITGLDKLTNGTGYDTNFLLSNEAQKFPWGLGTG